MIPRCSHFISLYQEIALFLPPFLPPAIMRQSARARLALGGSLSILAGHGLCRLGRCALGYVVGYALSCAKNAHRNANSVFSKGKVGLKVIDA